MVQTKPTMNDMINERKKQQLEILRKKYFWQQKKREIGILSAWIILVALLVCTLVPLIGLATYNISPDLVCSSNINGQGIFQSQESQKCFFTGSYWEYVALGFVGVMFLLLFSMLAFIVIGPLIWAIRLWIRSNWDTADERARKKLGLPKEDKESNAYTYGAY